MTFVTSPTTAVPNDRLCECATDRLTSHEAHRLERSLAAVEKADAAYRAGWGLWDENCQQLTAGFDLSLLERFAPEQYRLARYLASEAQKANSVQASPFAASGFPLNGATRAAA